MADVLENPFSEEDRATGGVQRRVLERLTQIWAHLLLYESDDEAAQQRRVTVMDHLDAEASRIEVHEPIRDRETAPRLSAGAAVMLIRYDEGLCLGGHGEIETVKAHPDYIAYRVHLAGDAYRRERRDAFRVPVRPTDDVSAAVYADDDSGGPDEIACRVEDLSLTGCRLSLVDTDQADALDAALQAGGPVGLGLPDESAWVHNAAERVWHHRDDAGVQQWGLCWRDPKSEFMRAVRRFVMGKERQRLKRRSKG